MSADLPACIDHLSGGTFAPPSDRQRTDLEPCGYCFPEGEVDVAEDDLLVGQSPDNRGRLHRDQDTGPIEWDHRGGRKLAFALQDPEVSHPTDVDWSEIRGGDA